jgi:hypothetical protein
MSYLLRRRRQILLFALIFSFLMLWPGRVLWQAAPAPAAPGVLVAHMYDSGFPQGQENYSSCFVASDGRVYYVLDTNHIEVGAQMYVLDPSTKTVRHLGDLTEAVGEKNLHAIPQGKSHVQFVEANGKLYFATHLGYYDHLKYFGNQVAPTGEGYGTYPGGHFLSYDLSTGKFEEYAKAPAREGIIGMTMDPQRGRLYGLTWPSGLFLWYDLKTHEMKNMGPVAGQAENGTGANWNMLDRSLSVNLDDGSCYFTISSGTIFRYRYDTNTIEQVLGTSLDREHFGCWADVNRSNCMGYNWLVALWSPDLHAFYAIHGKSGYLFRFDPRAEEVEVLTRFVSDGTRRSGMNDLSDFGYLGFAFGPSGKTLYHLTGSPVKGTTDRTNADSNERARRASALDLVTYEISSEKQIDHGVVQLEDGSRPIDAQAMAVGKDGMVYAIAAVGRGHRSRRDLISFKNPVPNP